MYFHDMLRVFQDANKAFVEFERIHVKGTQPENPQDGVKPGQ
jgi:hypothetical protein